MHPAHDSVTVGMGAILATAVGPKILATSPEKNKRHNGGYEYETEYDTQNRTNPFWGTTSLGYWSRKDGSVAG